MAYNVAYDMAKYKSQLNTVISSHFLRLILFCTHSEWQLHSTAENSGRDNYAVCTEPNSTSC